MPSGNGLNQNKFDSTWRSVCVVAPVSIKQLRGMVRQHYLGRRPAVVVLPLGMFKGPFLVGMCMFALPPKQTMKRYGGLTWELARLWIQDDVPRNAETWLIGKAVKHIRRHFPDVQFLVSYADPSVGHSGTIYKAANWTSDGMTDDERKSPRCDYVDASGKRYSRRAHIPDGLQVKRVPRVSKFRFVYALA